MVVICPQDVINMCASTAGAFEVTQCRVRKLRTCVFKGTVPIYLFRHFCCRMYLLATEQYVNCVHRRNDSMITILL